MSDPDSIDAMIEAAAQLLHIEVSDEALPVVRLNLEIAARMAQALDGFELDEREEPAPVFTP